MTHLPILSPLMTAKQRVIMILEVWRRECKVPWKVNKGSRIRAWRWRRAGRWWWIRSTDKEHEKWEEPCSTSEVQHAGKSGLW